MELHCRLSVENIFHYCDQNRIQLEDSDKTFLELWHKTARGLFSDEVLSLRNVKEIMECWKSNIGEIEKKHQLGSLLHSKMPSLGERCSHLFASYVMDLHKKHSNNKDIRDLEGEQSPMRVLIKAAWIAPDDHCTFPEYVNLIPQARQYHPILRLAAWVLTVYGME